MSFDPSVKQERPSSSSGTTEAAVQSITSSTSQSLTSSAKSTQHSSSPAHQHSNSSSSNRLINLIPLLTDLQYGSAALFSTFLVVHLAAPVTPLLTLGRSRSSAAELAGKTMILGRVYYQSTLTEPVIVWGSLALHLSAGIAKRVIRTFSTRSRRRDLKLDAHHAFHDDEELNTSSTAREEGLSVQISRRWRRLRASLVELRRSLPSISQHQAAGYLLFPFLLQHTLLNRIIPVRAEAPIWSLSPSELDYTYVSFGLERFSLITGIAYAGLVGLGSWHVVSGAAMVRGQLGRRIKRRSEEDGEGQESLTDAAKSTSSAMVSRSRKGARGGKKNHAVIAGTCTGVLFAALLKLGREAGSEVASLPTGLLNRYDACYSLVWPYSLVRSR